VLPQISFFRKVCFLLPLIALFLSAPLSASSPPFETIYQWEPLSVSEGVNRLVAGASIYPRSGPFRDEKLLAFSVRERVLVAGKRKRGQILY